MPSVISANLCGNIVSGQWPYQWQWRNESVSIVCGYWYQCVSMRRRRKSRRRIWRRQLNRRLRSLASMASYLMCVSHSQLSGARLGGSAARRLAHHLCNKLCAGPMSVGLLYLCLCVASTSCSLFGLMQLSCQPVCVFVALPIPCSLRPDCVSYLYANSSAADSMAWPSHFVIYISLCMAGLLLYMQWLFYSCGSYLSSSAQCSLCGWPGQPSAVALFVLVCVWLMAVCVSCVNG